MNKYSELLEIKQGSIAEIKVENGRMAVAPELGGRVFAELCGRCIHRIDPIAATLMDSDFHNIGGNSFWPAPEGGAFGFNYRGDEWYVQEAINMQPFELIANSERAVCMAKRVSLINRAKTLVEAEMKREIAMGETPVLLAGCTLEGSLTYITNDTFNVLNSVPMGGARGPGWSCVGGPESPRHQLEKGLIGSWSLEQFEASEDTIAFCKNQSPRDSINFDYYDDPSSRITYMNAGFTYKTDGKARGQIGIKKTSEASFIGFYDLSAKLLCIKQNLAQPGGVYFNIADNDQPNGPYSAADNYSIFNSDAGLFELETIGPAHVSDGLLKGSQLTSATTFAIFRNERELRSVVAGFLGISE